MGGVFSLSYDLVLGVLLCGRFVTSVFLFCFIVNRVRYIFVAGLSRGYC